MGLLVAVLWGWMAAQTGFSSGFVVHQPGDAAEAYGKAKKLLGAGQR